LHCGLKQQPERQKAKGKRQKAKDTSLIAGSAEAPARGEWFLVDSRYERIEGLPLLVFVAHVVEGTLKGKRQKAKG